MMSLKGFSLYQFGEKPCKKINEKILEFHIYLLMKVKPNESIGLLGSLYKAGNGHVKHPKNANN